MFPFTDQQVREAALADNPLAREAFLTDHQADANVIVNTMAEFYRNLDRCVQGWPLGERRQTVMWFLHIAGNSVICSVNLLSSGMLVPAGNLMRQFGEALAIALLCTVPSTGVLDRYLQESDKFPFDEALALVEKRQNKRALSAALGLMEAGWKLFRSDMRRYNHHSHAGMIPFGAYLGFDAARPVIFLGPEYDPHKVEFFRQELAHSQAASRMLLNVLVSVDRVMRTQSG